MNPLKCALSVHVGDLLGFVVHKKGIEMNPNKTKAILNTSSSSNKKQLHLFLGRINFLGRFISNLSDKIKVFSPLLRLKKEERFKWESEYE